MNLHYLGSFKIMQIHLCFLLQYVHFMKCISLALRILCILIDTAMCLQYFPSKFSSIQSWEFSISKPIWFLASFHVLIGLTILFVISTEFCKRHFLFIGSLWIPYERGFPTFLYFLCHGNHFIKLPLFNYSWWYLDQRLSYRNQCKFV